MFESFTQPERSSFLKFVWGRATLPQGDKLNSVGFKLMLEYEGKYENHDIMLPNSHTCFFQFDLPRYTTDEICKSKILYACTTCGSIDTDNQANEVAYTSDSE